MNDARFWHLSLDDLGEVSASSRYPSTISSGAQNSSPALAVQIR